MEDDKITSIEQKYLKIMKKLDKDFKKYGDNEFYHIDYDNLIVDVLKETGLEKLAECYAKASSHFWYS